MSHLVAHPGVSVVTAVVPQHTANRVIESVFAAGDRYTLLINARGTLRRDHWYQALLPMMSPEKEYLQFLVPDREVEQVMHAAISAGELHLPAAGAVFAIPCSEFAADLTFKLWSDASWEDEAAARRNGLRENLTAIYCIVRMEQTDDIARAAMNAGAHGPVVFYCDGRGLRDRLGWLRITRKADKETLLVIVDNADAVTVSDAMVEAGDIGAPGHGFLYRMPIQTGLINIGSTPGSRRYAANMQQIIAAIDGLKGNTEWRDQRVNALLGTARSAGLALFGKMRERPFLTAQCSLACIVGRRHVDTVLDAARRAGAPGAHISYGKLLEAGGQATPRGLRLNRERALIRLIVPDTHRPTVWAAISAVCGTAEIRDICLYSQPVTRAVTYLPEVGTPLYRR